MPHSVTEVEEVSPWLQTTPEFFPMFTMLVKELMKLTEMKPHETLLAEGQLTEFKCWMGKAAFVSHQWASNTHPDPDMKQFKVLQDALANLLSGASKIQADIAFEVVLGLSQVRAASKVLSSQSAESLYIWYDYFSCPQLGKDGGDLRRAIDSIPSYITRSDLFLALNPAIEGENTQVINELSWAKRGWCLLEKSVWEMKGPGATCIVIKSAKHCEINFWTVNPPGTGAFSVEQDKQRILPGFKTLIKNRLLLYAAKGDLINFRLLLNRRKHHLKNLPLRENDDDSELGVALTDTTQSPESPAKMTEGEVVSQFLRENHFKHFEERDSSGWSPMCYAAMRGDVKILKALLAKKGNPNDKTTKARNLDQSSKHMPLLSICTQYDHFDAMKLLIQHGAKVNVKTGQPPLHMACAADSMEAIGVLCDHGADTRHRTDMGASCVLLAACSPAPNALEEIFKRQGEAPDLSGAPLFLSVATRGSARTVRLLIQAQADLNEQWVPSLTNPFGLLLRVKSLQYRLGRTDTRLAVLAYHHLRATPLMAALLCGNFEAAATLIDEGATLHLRNSRGKTARDFAREMSAPDYVLEALEAGNVKKCASFVSALSSSQHSATVAGQAANCDDNDDSFSI